MERGSGATAEARLGSRACVGGKAEGGKKPQAAEFECSICYELLLDPVVGSCGHDFCKHCYETWTVVSKKCTCPICRKVIPPDLGVCVRLKSTIEALFPQRVRERQRQREAELAEECAKKPRTSPFPAREGMDHDDGAVPPTFDGAVAFERVAGMLTGGERHHIRVLSVEELAQFTLLLDHLNDPNLRPYASAGSTSAMPAGLLPIHMARGPTHSTPLSHGESQDIRGAGSGEQGIGVPAAAVLSIPAAITVPPWIGGALAASAPVGVRAGFPAALQQVLTQLPALVLSPTSVGGGRPAGQVAPVQWGAPLDNVVFTMGLYERNPTTARRRMLRRRMRT